MDASTRDPDRDDAGRSGDRERLDPELVTRVLTAFGIATPRRLRDVDRGSRRAPKVVVETGEGRFFLKRRRPGSVEAARFTARLQRRLAAAGCPVPRIRSTLDGEAVHECEGHVFELVEFVAGDPYPRHPVAANSAGRTLARLHEEMRHLSAPERLRGSYHDSSLVREVLGRLRERVDELSLDPMRLSDRYEHAAASAQSWFEGRPPRLIHGDFHPGNLIHDRDSDGRVLAVLDWEAVRVDLPQAEFAAAAVHFARPPSSARPRVPGLDETLLTSFVAGFGVLRRETSGIVPELMIESVIAEVAFLLDGGVRGERAARLAVRVEGLLDWIDRNRSAISRIVQGEASR